MSCNKYSVCYLTYYTVFLWSRKTGEAVPEEDDENYMTYVNQAQYELKTGTPEVALSYLNVAIGLQPEDDIPYMVRSKCLIKYEAE